MNGAYDIREVYPLGKWLVLEAFDTRYRTTGVSYRGENEKSWTTRLGGLVDIDFLPIIGLGGEIDWGVQPYDPGTNGGIAGTVSYDTTRNELDPAQAVSEGYQPGIPGVTGRPVLLAPLPHRPDRRREGGPVPAGQGDRAAQRHRQPGPRLASSAARCSRAPSPRSGRRRAAAPPTTPRAPCSPTSARCRSSARPRTGPASRRR